ncbi:MAG TPA: signal recognition particle protein [Dissulfurispiraceae bacterium]|nr:signal recognition particle protein [Dissulfurispiraceae bacterium]
MFESLSDKLDAVFKKLKGRGVLKEEDVDAALKEVRVALLEADVNFKVVKDFIAQIRERAVGKEVLESLTPGQQVIKIVHDALCDLLGTVNVRIQLAPNPPTVIMMIGLQGSGKTTTTGKLARVFRKEGRRPLLVAADLQRPAAIDQLITLGKQLDLPVYSDKGTKDPVAVCREALKKARLDGRDVVLVDTAGRLHIDDELMDQLRKVKEAVQPKEVLFVADAMTGQDAVNSAKTFNEKIGIDGIILTKMDGDARGGAALSVRHVTGRPIKYMGVGEKIDMLEPFHPDRIAKRILGMGDVVTFIEQAQDAYDQKEAAKLANRIMEDSFTFEDLREQLKKLRNMGPLENILGMIPGMGKAIKDVKVDEKEFVRIDAIINSMTNAERRDHDLLNGSRRKRIAMGSGTTVADVNRLVKQFLEMRKMMKMMKGGMGGKKGFRMPKFPMPF